jgi:polyphosphate kinase
MSENQGLEELNTKSMEQVFETLFRADDAVPPRLYEPARYLTLALDSTRTVQERTMDLSHMSRETEMLFRRYLSPLSVVGGQSQTTSTVWPIALARWTEYLHERATKLLIEGLLPELADAGFHILSVSDTTDGNADWVHRYFQEQLYPLLTPLAVDPGRPFPYISSDSLNLLVELKGGIHHEPTILFARVKIPSIAPRLVRILDGRDDAGAHRAGLEPAAYIWSVDLVRYYVSELFVDIPIRGVHCFRVLRAPAALGAPSRNAGRGRAVRGRDARGPVVRVDVESAMPPGIFDWLVDHLDVISYSVVRYDVPEVAMSLPQLADAVQQWTQAMQ